MQDRDTDADWEKLAQHEPYWAVLTHDKFKRKNLDEDTRRDFFDSGTGYVDKTKNVLTKLSDGPFTPRSALDFGCGVGRLVIPMSRDCERVVGVDISDSMRTECKKQSLGTPGIELYRTLEDVPNARFDWVNTCIVLQHIPPERGIVLVRTMLAMLEPNGGVSLQVTFFKERKLLGSLAYINAFQSAPGVVKPLEELPAGPGTPISMYDYDLNRIFYELIRAGVRQMRVWHEDHGGIHALFIAGVRSAAP